MSNRLEELIAIEDTRYELLDAMDRVERKVGERFIRLRRFEALNSPKQIIDREKKLLEQAASDHDELRAGWQVLIKRRDEMGFREWADLDEAIREEDED